MVPRLSRGALRLRVRRSVVLLPTLYIVAAVVLGYVVPIVDRGGNFPLRIRVDIATAHEILSATSTGMLAFTGLVVSSTLVVVQFAASQYSPRLVLWFRQDTLVKHAIGSFLAASIYPVVALRELTTGSEIRPDLSVALALVLLIGAAVLFLALLQRVLDRLRPRNLLGVVLEQGIRAGRFTYPLTLHAGQEPADESWISPRPRTLVLRHHRGVLVAFDRTNLLQAAFGADVTIELVPAVGEYLAPGDPLFRVHGAGEVDDGRLLRAIVVSDERTIAQDPAFALRMMVDTAIRALSPAVNDPTTAVQALDTISALVRDLAGRDLEASVARGPDGRVRVVWPAPSWAGLLDLACAEIRQYGAGAIQVARRQREMLHRLKEVTDPIRHPALDRELAALDTAVRGAHASGSVELELAMGADRMGLGLRG